MPAVRRATGVDDILARHASAAPASTALIVDGVEFSFGQVAAAAAEVAKTLAPNTRVVAQLRNNAASIVAVHAAWLITLWTLGRDQAVNLLAFAVFVLLQGLRVWIVATLGSRWTTRIIVLLGKPLVTSGPYRFIAHPNYAVVAAEIAILPLALHLPITALVFTFLNAVVLFIRIRAESSVLSEASSWPAMS